MKIIITEEQLKRIIVEQNKTTSEKPTNKTHSLSQNIILTKDSLIGGQLKIPKGTRFTAHQNGNKKLTTPTYTASVDRNQGGQIKPSTVFYCNGPNAGKFWNDPSKSWYYDKTRVLSGFLSKNLCGKSFADQSYWENKKIDIKGQRTPVQIANFLRSSNTLDDNEPAIERAFSEIKTWERYNLVKKYLGQDPYKFVSQFIDVREKHGLQSVTTSYSILSKGPTSDQNKTLDASNGCPVVLTASRPGGPKQYLGSINYMKFFKGPAGTPGADPLLVKQMPFGTFSKIPDFGWKINNEIYPYPKYYDQSCLDKAKQITSSFNKKEIINKNIQSDINRQEYMQKRDSETTNVVNRVPVKNFKNPLSLSESANQPKDYQEMINFNQSLSKQKELIPKFCKTPLERQWDSNTGSGDYKLRMISMYNLCKDYGGLWVYGVGGSEYTCGCRDNSNPALTVGIKTDTGTFNASKEIKDQQGSKNWANVDARSVLWGTAALASAFIPVVGPFVAAGIGLGGAADLWTSNKKKEAAITAFFALLPMVGKIPGVGNITKGIAEELKLTILNNGALTEKQLETLMNIIKFDEQVSAAMVPAIERQAAGKLQSHIIKTAIEETEKKVIELSGVPTYGDLKKAAIKKTIDPVVSSIKA